VAKSQKNQSYKIFEKTTIQYKKFYIDELDRAKCEGCVLEEWYPSSLRLGRSIGRQTRKAFKNKV
jgi:hypothetical protein